MSADIVARLRNFDRNTPFAKDLVLEAANEIEKLRNSTGSTPLAKDLDAAGEIEKLRNAIRKHRQDVWGEDVPTHDADIALYSGLEASAEENI